MQTLSTKNIYTVGVVALILGLLFNYCFFDKQIGISFFVYIVLLLAGLFGMLWFFNIAYNKAVLWYLPLIVFFSGMIAIRDSMFLLFWNFVVTIGLLILMSHHLTGKSLKDYLLFDYVKTAFLLPLKSLAKSFSAIGRMLTVGKGLKENQKSSQVIKGIVITLPLLVFFLVLLSSADLVFNRLISSLFKFNINPATAAQVWWALFFTFIWLGAYVFILEKAVPKASERAAGIPPGYKFGNIEAGILFGTLNVLFLVFVVIQIKYLFAGQSAITDLGLTYAEYAHKGFGELIAVALLTFGLIFATEKYIEKKDSHHFPFFKSLSAILVVLVLVIMASAFLRLSLYEQAYSFTLLRILVQGFILWLAAVFLWLGYKILFRMEDHTFALGIFLSVVAFFFIFNLLNPDALIARKNIERFAKADKLDGAYLSGLSADAAPEVAKLLDMGASGNNLPNIGAMVLSRYVKNESTPWQSYNYSRQAAAKIAASKRDSIIWYWR